jgi:large subunit ribosomal protein L2
MGKRLPVQRRGSGSPTYQSPSHRHKASNDLPKVHEGEAVVDDIQHNPGHSAPIALLRFEDGTTDSIPAPAGLAVGDEITIGQGDATLGSVLPLGNIPQGTYVYNIENQPGDGGKFVRSAGTQSFIVAKTPDQVIVQLPSGAFKELNPACRAAIGTIAGAGMKDKPIYKAGKKDHVLRSTGRYWPVVRGVAKNPVDHPFGGGNKQHTGRPKTVGRSAPPGAKVGSIAARRTGGEE